MVAPGGGLLPAEGPRRSAIHQVVLRQVAIGSSSGAMAIGGGRFLNEGLREVAKGIRHEGFGQQDFLPSVGQDSMNPGRTKEFFLVVFVRAVADHRAYGRSSFQAAGLGAGSVSTVSCCEGPSKYRQRYKYCLLVSYRCFSMLLHNSKALAS
ncbi:hypothetical protein NE237_019750 [Protea cynaroides]|uniref:Uncharacterized protein n=1 Tax=Protea cynaroides TaxID=273540 RepID=A0A9Q0K2T4_9MAGN|nr:hypothetical protein NE237_019750 [Protea cynaroides]